MFTASAVTCLVRGSMLVLISAQGLRQDRQGLRIGPVVHPSGVMTLLDMPKGPKSTTSIPHRFLSTRSVLPD